MIRKVYTRPLPPGLASRIGDNRRVMTAEEHALFTAGEVGASFESRDALVRWYMEGHSAKLPAVELAAREARARGYRSVLSLGSGPCVLEWELSRALPGCKVVASDYDAVWTERAGRLFPGLAVLRFDFAAGDLPALFKEFGGAPDMAVFFGSSYVMTDEQFLRVFRALRESGVREVIDFQAAFLGWMDCLREWSPATALKKIGFVRRVFGKGPVGRFHGYARSRGALRRLYSAAGWRLAGECAAGSYRYAGICEV